MRKKSAKTGRPSHEPTDQTRRQVSLLAGMGMPLKKVALVLGISFKTLLKHYGPEIEKGAAQVDAVLYNSFFHLIKEKNVPTVIFGCKTRLGWKEVQANHGETSKPVPRAVFTTSEEPPNEQIVSESKQRNGTND